MSWVITPEFKNKGLLDAYSGAAAAYSLRNLSILQNPYVVRVRRSSDNTESDFTAAQVSDGTLATFCGAGNGFVTTWYDQSGNGRHATQTTTANQPQIVSSGALVQEGSKPALRFNGSTQSLIVPTIAFNLNSLSVIAVAKDDGTSSGLFVSSLDILNTRVYFPLVDTAYKVGYADEVAKFNFGSSNQTLQYLVQLSAGASSANAWRNNIASTAVSSTSTASTGVNWSIGCFRGGSARSDFWIGTGQEVIIYLSDQTSNQTGMAFNINAHYAIY
jgi:hypothetical protein